jgi:hypothetical protein
MGWGSCNGVRLSRRCPPDHAREWRPRYLIQPVADRGRNPFGRHSHRKRRGHLGQQFRRDPEAGVLARTCQVQRQLSRLRDPHPLSHQLPRDRLNILLLTVRLFDVDVCYHSIQDHLPDQSVP